MPIYNIPLNGVGSGGGATITEVLEAEGFQFYTPVVAASLSPLTVTYNNGTAGVGATLTNAGTQAVFALDGVNPTVGQRVLIKNQAAELQNGIYTVTNVGSASTNWVLERAVDFDAPDEIIVDKLISITAGSQSATYWRVSLAPTLIGTDDIEFQLLNFFDIFATEASVNFENVTTTTKQMVPDFTYRATSNNVDRLAFTLPVECLAGKDLEIAGNGAGGWVIFLNAGQSIISGDQTANDAGSVSSQTSTDGIWLKCVETDTVFQTIVAPQGQIDFNVI